MNNRRSTAQLKGGTVTETNNPAPPSAASDRNSPSRQQHDERAKLLLSHDRTARELLAYTGALPTDRDVRLVRWSSEWIALQDNAGDVPARLDRGLGDQVWLVCEMDGRPLRTVLLEFKSDHDRGTARQTALYLFDLWEDGQKLAALRTGADSVPTRAALVYTGRTKWTADLSLPNVGLDGDIAPRPGIFLLDVGRTEPGDFPEGSLLSHIIPLERCRGQLQWEDNVDTKAVVAEAARLWEQLRLLATDDASLLQTLSDWLRTGFSAYVQGLKLGEGDNEMYATIDEAFEAHVASRVDQAVGQAVGQAVEQAVEQAVQRTTISLLIDYARMRHGDEAAAAAEGFLSDWQDSRLPTYNELDTLVTLQRDGQDPWAWWAEQIQSGQSPNSVNGETANGNTD